ncbi:PHP domain-containing protein [Amphritea sp. 1_MG-2023]|uniref:PHP domain-containing protein n=1 Tax=Amphritea sp. 1_MG-2023 TaxID=3062670 RepID=UPI0026E36DF3|nr:PHP domain-containing protein [Amphritea sp. 1_MG-2023]MDO6562779.1 PHP domain-containing protein [Amphritea sp. 1_MG-2023]
MSKLSYKPETGEELPFSDLHCHSCYSDGELTPVELLQEASESGVAVFAITDHDTVAGIKELRASATDTEIKVVAGIELTSEWGRNMVHIVGLGFDEHHPALCDYLEKIDQLRLQRAARINEKLMKRNIPDLLTRVLELSGTGQVGRPHFAQAMVEAGIVKNEVQAFNRYLGAGKVGDVKAAWPTMEEAISIIHQAGGVAVLAHPTKYRMTFTKVRILTESFCQQGGDAIEISYPSIESGHQLQLDKLASKYNLMISAGSDFHKKQFHWTAVGKYPRYSSQNDHVLAKLLQH